MTTSSNQKNDYDAVIIGGGHNGLICGSYLAKAGMKCLILEAREEVGGCASTVSVLDARVNICNCDHILFRSTNIAAELELDKHGLKYLEVDPLNLAIFWDGHPPWFIYKDPQTTISEMSQYYPDEAEGYRQYIKAASPVVQLIVAISNHAPTLGKSLKTLFPSHLKALKTLLKWQKMSAVEVLRKFFSHEALIQPAIGLGPAVWGVDVQAKGTGLGALSYALRHTIGIGRPEGGSGALTQALKNAFENYGGEVRCGAKVKHIHIANNKVSAVELESGEEISVGNAVSACDPRDMILNRLSGAPPKLKSDWNKKPQHDGYESKIDAIVPSLPTYSGLSSSHLSELDAGLLPTAVIMPGISEMREGYYACTRGEVPGRPAMLANYPSIRDPSMKQGLKSDSHVFSLEVLGTPYALKGGWGKSQEPKRWLKLYEGLLEESNFSENISKWRCMTPPDYESDFNLLRGYAPSFTGSPLSAVLHSPVSAILKRNQELTRYRSSIKGMFFTGAGTFPGAGIWGASGRNTAKIVQDRA